MEHFNEPYDEAWASKEDYVNPFRRKEYDHLKAIEEALSLSGFMVDFNVGANLEIRIKRKENSKAPVGEIFIPRDELENPFLTERAIIEALEHYRNYEIENPQ